MIILAISTTRQSPKTVEYALETAKAQGAKLLGLFIVDPSLPDGIFAKLTDIGFIGDKPSEHLHQSILKEYENRATKRLMEICEMSKAKGLECETIIREGEFLKECLDVIKEKKADMVILTRAKRSYLSRFLFGSAVSELMKYAPCPVKVVEEN